MTDAIIGYSGFVGGALTSQHYFDRKFNSTNIRSIGSAPYDTVVCSAAPGSMFTANRQPDVDRALIDALIENLAEVRTRRFVLISSIAVLADFAGGDDENTQAFQKDLAYGRHRRLLETFCADRFDECLIVRLPALFGANLRKNFIFDLMNPVPTMLPAARLDTLLQYLQPSLRRILVDLYSAGSSGEMCVLDRPSLNLNPLRSEIEDAVQAVNMTSIQFHNPASTFQYYNLENLWRDIGMAHAADLRCLHLVTEPLRAADIHARLMGCEMPQTGARLHREDMRTRHAALWQRNGPYLADSDKVLEELAAFFTDQKQAA